MEQRNRMRTIALLWWLLLGVLGIQGQSAGDIDTLSQWDVHKTTADPPYMYYYNYTYYISGTITIDTVIYYKVHANGYSQVNSYPPNYFNGYHAPLRESGNKWYTVDDNDEDVLLYDFTLGIGDTVDSYANFYGGSEIITIIALDTIIIDGEPKKKLYLSVDFGAEFIIEDVGANTGIWESLTWFENYSILNCYAKDFIPIWINPESGSCGVSTEIIESQIEKDLSAYPNPFTTATTIEFSLDEKSKIQISIYNTIGEVVYYKEYPFDQGTHKVTWSPRHLPAGLYYAVLRSEAGVSVVKMVKQ